MNQYKHIFFDLDRTLWDFEKNSQEALSEIFHHFTLGSHIASEGRFIEKYHFFNDLLWDDYRKGRLTKEMLRKERFEKTLAFFGVHNPEMASSINTMYLEVCPKKCFLVPHTHKIIEYLYKKYQLYILTNGFKETQHKKLFNTGLLPFFKQVFTSEEIGTNKPKPGIFAYAMNSLNARKHECLMIGDDYEVDILGAMNYGIDQVWLYPGNNVKSPKPTYSVSSLDKLASFL